MPFLGKTSSGNAETRFDLRGSDVASPSLTSRGRYRPSDIGSLERERVVVHSGRIMCGSKECSGTRPMPWRNRRRPIFEGLWGCSKRCLLDMVRAAVRREYGEISTTADGAPHRHRVPLGLVLLAQGWITQSQLQRALDAQRSGGGRIGERLVAQGGIEHDHITRGLSVQWGCPVLTTAGFDAREMALTMPKLFVEEFGVLPVRTAGARILYLGFEDHLDASLALGLERMTNLKVGSGLLIRSDIQSARANLAKARDVPAKFETMAEPDLLGIKIATLLEDEQPAHAQLVRMHQYFWLRLWLEEGTMRGVGTLPRSSEDMKDYIFSVKPAS
jgi:hypothetical protein